jgi:hypothetical protein
MRTRVSSTLPLETNVPAYSGSLVSQRAQTDTEVLHPHTQHLMGILFPRLKRPQREAICFPTQPKMRMHDL